MDRYSDVPDKLPRELFLASVVFDFRLSRLRASMGLIRSGRKPKLKPKGGVHLLPLDQLKGDIAEETHFYIDFGTERPVLCIEFNNHGPKHSDIVYCLRQVAWKQLEIAKALKSNILLRNPIDETLQKFQNVLRMEIKARPKDLESMNLPAGKHYFTSWKTLNYQFEPESIRVETFFRTSGPNKLTVQNRKANHFFVEVLKLMHADPNVIEVFDEFEVDFLNSDGEDDLFNLLKTKEQFFLDIDMNNRPRKSEMYGLVCPHIDEYMARRG